MTKAELIAALAEVPDQAEVRVFVDEDLPHREHNDALDVDYVDTRYAVGESYIRTNQGHPFVTLRVAEADDRAKGIMPRNRVYAA